MAGPPLLPPARNATIKIQMQFPLEFHGYGMSPDGKEDRIAFIKNTWANAAETIKKAFPGWKVRFRSDLCCLIELEKE